MKFLSFLTGLVLIVSSCNKEDERVGKMTATVNGEQVDFASEQIAQATHYTDKLNDQDVRQVYHLKGYLPTLIIFAYDSTFTQREFTSSDLEASFAQGIGDVKYYSAVSGNMNINNDKDGVWFGNFDLVMVNDEDEADTVFIDEGAFEITYNEASRDL